MIGFTFRNAGSYTVSFWSGGIASCYIGAYIGDKFEHKFKKIKGYTAAIGPSIGCVFLFACYILQPGFYLCILFQFLYILFSECWYGPIYAMFNKVLPPEA